MEILIFWWVVCGIIGYFVGSAYDRPVAGFWYGLLLGPIGIVVCCCFGDSGPRKQRKEDRILARRYLADQYRANHRG